MDEKHVAAYINRGNLYKTIKEYALALDDFSKAIKLDAKSVDAYINRGNLYKTIGEHELALYDFNKAIELDDMYVDAYIDRGNLYKDNREYELALDDFNKAVELDEKHIDAYINRGNLYKTKEEYKLAQDDFNIAIDLDDKYVDAYINRGNLFKAIGQYELALGDFNKAIQLDDKYLYTYINRGNLHYDSKEYDKALPDYNKAIELDDKYVDAYINRGNLYRAKREYELALKNYDKALGLDDKYIDAYINRGNLRYDKKELDKALADYNKAIQLNDKCANAYIGRGIVYSFRREYGKALDDFNKALELDKNSAYAYDGLGYLYYIEKNYEKSLALFNKAIQLDKNYAYAFNDRGNVYYSKGEYTEALKDFQTAIKIDDKFADAYYNCGIVYHEQQMYKEALKYYEKAKDLSLNEGDTFRVLTLNEIIPEINGLLSKPTEENQKIKLLMDRIDEEKIEKRIIEAGKSFKEFIMEKNRSSAITIPEFIILRRWNSYTPIIADKNISKGGGYFFKTKDFGIVIDPGFNFIDNFKSAGYQFDEIDHILITHAHNDHTTDLESILTLLHQYNEAILGDFYTDDDSASTIIQEIRTQIKEKKAIDRDYKDYIERLAKNDNDYKDYIEKLAKERFALSSRRKRIRIYMSSSTFKKYATMLNLYKTSDYDIILIKANDEIPILPPGMLRQPEYAKDLRITAIKAKHNDLLSDKDSLGCIIHYKDSILIYTGDTGYSPEIEKQYRAIHDKYSECTIVLLAHLGGFKEYENKFDASESLDSNWEVFYKNHLGRLGLAKLVEVLKPKICIISEFGEEFKDTRLDLSRIFKDVYGDDVFFIPADIGLCINTDNEIKLVDDYDDKVVKTAFYQYTETSVTELPPKAALVYYSEKSVNKNDLEEHLLKFQDIRHY